MKRIFKISILLFAVVAVFFLAIYFYQGKNGDEEASKKDEPVVLVDEKTDRAEGKIEIVASNEEVEDVPVSEKEEKTSDYVVAKDIHLDVPFVLQAPFANWSDPVFEDACEEAAILMADGWIKGKKISSQEAYDGILEIVKIEDNILGEHIDASGEDTMTVLKKYSGYEKVSLKKNILISNMVSELSAGNMVIVPTNGKKLGNPNYTTPGPITHMIVIIGYDKEKKEFITNDSGTRKGKDYRYAEKVLFEAVRDYPTGNHYINPIDETDIVKSMIVVEKK